MAIQPVSLEAVAVQVVLALVGIKPEHEGVGRSICPKAKFPIIPVIAFWVAVAELGQAAAILQDASILIVKTQSIDDLVEFIFEILRFQIVPVTCPRGEKGLSVAVQIAAQMADAAGLSFNLTALGIAVHPLLRCHGSDGKFHYRSRSLLDLCCLFCSAGKRCRLRKDQYSG